MEPKPIEMMIFVEAIEMLMRNHVLPAMIELAGDDHEKFAAITASLSSHAFALSLAYLYDNDVIKAYEHHHKALKTVSLMLTRGDGVVN